MKKSLGEGACARKSYLTQCSILSAVRVIANVRVTAPRAPGTHLIQGIRGGSNEAIDYLS